MRRQPRLPSGPRQRATLAIVGPVAARLHADARRYDCGVSWVGHAILAEYYRVKDVARPDGPTERRSRKGGR